MGWWRETIDIVKKNDPAAHVPRWSHFDYPGVKALAAHRVSHFLWNHGFKLLARTMISFGVLDPGEIIQVRPLLLCLYRPWSGPRYQGNGHC